MKPEPRQVDVALGERSYRIHIGEGLLDDAGLLAASLPARQVMVVSNQSVAPLYLPRLRAALGERQLAAVTLPDGEQEKCLESMLPVFDEMLVNGFGRDCQVIALGGGVIGDLAGFVAATYQRGVDFVQMPTTLLAMVDSAVGGKTGVNHPRGKNMIGAFHQPRAVIADLGVLDSLPDRELRAGMAEVIKYALLGDRAFLDWLEANIDAALARDTAALAYIVERCCRNKAAIVAADERETGERALLNLGHTFAHALEAVSGFGTWSHGAAVAWGIVRAMEAGQRLGLTPDDYADRVRSLITAYGFHTGPTGEDVEAMINAMRYDKKRRAGRLRLVLQEGLGWTNVQEVDESLVRKVLTAAE